MDIRRLMLACLVPALFLACGPKKPVSVHGVSISAELLENAEAQAFDYTGHLAKSLKQDAKSLHELFRFSQRTDTAASAAHGKVLKSVLEATGDEFFARTIAGEPDETRRQVWALLDASLAGIPGQSLKTVAPLTCQALFPVKESLMHKGLYSPSEKVNTFFDCGSPGSRFVVIDESGKLEPGYKNIIRYPYPGQCVFAEAEGFTTSFFGARPLPDNYAGFLIVTELVELKKKNFRNTCIPYELWAIGNEPYWHAQISAAEGVIEFSQIGDERVTVFKYVNPIVQDSTQVYAAINEDTGDNIRIVVHSAPCSDGMSAGQYQARVDLTVNGGNFSGCGIYFNQAGSLKEN